MPVLLTLLVLLFIEAAISVASLLLRESCSDKLLELLGICAKILIARISSLTLVVPCVADPRPGGPCGLDHRNDGLRPFGSDALDVTCSTIGA